MPSDATIRLAGDLAWRDAEPAGPPWRVRRADYGVAACRALALMPIRQGDPGWWGVTERTYELAEKILRDVVRQEWVKADRRRLRKTVAA